MKKGRKDGGMKQMGEGKGFRRIGKGEKQYTGLGKRRETEGGEGRGREWRCWSNFINQRRRGTTRVSGRVTR